ncbi:MAG TPA: DNRLRE domain-containing protein [Candidatus Dormibacteraeota bacterium]|nr:DNRLRE domain-containing protein [Candidatus Dormibacteraeota bacterium]
MAAMRALAVMTLTIGLFSGPAGATQVMLSPTADTYLRSGAQNGNDGSATFVRINSSPNRALVRFDQTQIAGATSGLVLISATLELFVNSSAQWGSPGRAVNAHRVTADWTEAGATWNCPIDTNPGNSSPDCASQWAGGTFAPTATDAVLQSDAIVNQYVSWDVTADVVALLTGTPNAGWMIRKELENQNGNADFNSREAAANRPLLVPDVVAPTSTATATATNTPTPSFTRSLTVTTATVLFGYNSTTLSIPGTGTATTVRQRVVAPAPVPQAFTPNDLEYAVQVLVSRNTPLAQLFTATFDRCASAPAPTLADLSCTVLSCAQGGGGVSGCACTVSLP